MIAHFVATKVASAFRGMEIPKYMTVASASVLVIKRENIVLIPGRFYIHRGGTKEAERGNEINAKVESARK